MCIRVMLVDDHPIVRQGLHRLLEFEPDVTVVAEAGDGLEAIELVERHRPDVLILDLMMPGLNGLEVARHLQHSHPKILVIVLTMHQDTAYILQALRSGARGYVIKDCSPHELIRAIRQVMAGERYLSAAINAQQIDLMLAKADQSGSLDPFESLSSRERVVMQLIVEGHTNAEVAHCLSISPRTVEAHRARIMHKLKLSNNVELIRYAIKSGMV